MRPTFGREYIENEFQRIAEGLSDPLTVYLIGGGAMSLRDLKGATKDIDLVVADGDAYGQLWAVLMDLEYAEVQSLDDDYQALGATSCMENADGCRLDIFNQQVANKLILTEGMRERSESFLDTDPVAVRLVSNEDIFLFKAIAGRDDDIEDMNMLVQTGLDYDIVAAELEAQIDRLGDDQFATFANEALVELEEWYGVTTPVADRIQELTERYYRGLEVRQILDKPMTVDELAAELNLDTDEVRDRIVYLSTFNRVHRDGDTVCPVE
jgi:predicted nucleotidyltransferase